MYDVLESKPNGGDINVTIFKQNLLVYSKTVNKKAKIFFFLIMKT